MESRAGYSPKNWLGCAAHFSKPLLYLWPKYAKFAYPIYDQIFDTLFMTWPLNQNPISDLRYNKFPSSDQ